MVYSGLGRSRKIRSHRRQLSDPKIHLDIHSGKEDGIESEYGRVSKKALKRDWLEHSISLKKVFKLSFEN